MPLYTLEQLDSYAVREFMITTNFLSLAPNLYINK
jgi:hypothetical protein